VKRNAYKPIISQPLDRNINLYSVIPFFSNKRHGSKIVSKSRMPWTEENLPDESARSALCNAVYQLCVQSLKSWRNVSSVFSYFRFLLSVTSVVTQQSCKTLSVNILFATVTAVRSVLMSTTCWADLGRRLAAGLSSFLVGSVSRAFIIGQVSESELAIALPLHAAARRPGCQVPADTTVASLLSRCDVSQTMKLDYSWRWEWLSSAILRRRVISIGPLSTLHCSP